jgi:hypothetical protein
MLIKIEKTSPILFNTNLPAWDFSNEYKLVSSSVNITLVERFAKILRLNILRFKKWEIHKQLIWKSFRQRKQHYVSF